MKLSNRGYAKLKLFESCVLTAYLDQAGVWTIGWGHTGRKIVEGLVWTQAQADRALADDVAVAESCVASRVHPKLTQGQFDALVMFVFNIGGPAFKSSTMLRMLNEGKLSLARLQFARWNKVTIDGVLTVSNGLTRRRQMEYEVFGSEY